MMKILMNTRFRFMVKAPISIITCCVLIVFFCLILLSPEAIAGSYRLININSSANPFLGIPELGYGGSKHVYWGWHPINKRVYTWGGDYGANTTAFGQPSDGSAFTTSAPSGARSYATSSSLRNDQYSFDPYGTGSLSWRLEHPYLPRNMGGARESRPARPDQASLVWDSTRNKFWGIYTALRTEFLYYLADGTTPDMWANGDSTTTGNIEPVGTWSFAPSANGGAGTWTLETSARTTCRTGTNTYDNNILITGNCDERIAYWEYDKINDRIVAFGYGAIFIFDPNTKSYQYRMFSPSGYGYFNPCSSPAAIVGGWMHGVALTNYGGTRKSQLIRVNIANMLALSNGASIPNTGSYWEAIQLPWSLSPGNVWESSNDASSKWQEHAGVLAIAGKVVIIKSYDRLVEDGVTKMTVWDPATRVFTPADPPPESNIAANSWVALPDSGEVLFGLNTSGYTNSKLWAYKISTGTPSAVPSAPTGLQVR